MPPSFVSSATNLFSSNAPADESSDNRGEGKGVTRINQEELIDISHTLLRRFRCSSCCLRKHTCILYETHPRNARFFFHFVSSIKNVFVPGLEFFC